MGEPLSQEKLSGEIKRLRITLTFITKRGDVGSLDPLWQEFVGRKMFEMARRTRASRPGKGLIVVSDKPDLSVTLPSLPDFGRTFGPGFVIGSIVGLILFLSRTAPLLWVAIMGVLGGFAGILIIRSTSTNASVRGNLPGIMAVSDALASWLAAGSGRKMHLETVDKIHVEADAKTPEEIEPMFKAAVAAQEQGANSAGPSA
jgi:hypothetical protein